MKQKNEATKDERRTAGFATEETKLTDSASKKTNPADLEALLEERTNDLKRLRADFENYRKQIEQQKENDRRLTECGTVMKLLPLLDDLDRAFSAYEELGPLKKSLDKTLKELKLERIDTTKGVEFSPDLHDAVMVEGDGEVETVAETLRPGYYYEKSVLRPAMVKVVRN